VDRAEIDALRGEMQAGFSRLEGKIDAYIASHSVQHSGEQEKFQGHLIEAALRKGDVERIEERFEGERVTERIRALEDAHLTYQVAAKTSAVLLKFTFGTSVLGLVGTAVGVAKVLGWI